MVKLMLLLVMVALVVANCVSADNSDPINDFCVADLKMDIMFNDLACKRMADVTSEDFRFKGFRATADTNNSMEIGIVPGFAAVNYPALNTQGFSLAKINYAKHGLVTPHTHPKAAEVITVTKGEIYAGFVCTSRKLSAVTLKVGDFFVFPKGLVHFHANVGNGHSATLSVLNAQNPDKWMVANALFGSMPTIKNMVLNKAFMISNEMTDGITKGFMPSTM